VVWFRFLPIYNRTRNPHYPLNRNVGLDTTAERTCARHFRLLAVDDFYASTQKLQGTASFRRQYNSPASQIPRILWTPKDYYSVLKSPSLVTIPGQTNPVPAFDSSRGVSFSYYVLSSTRSKNTSEALCNISTPHLEENPLSTVHHRYFNQFPSCSPYLEAVSFPRLRTRHAVEAGAHLTWSKQRRRRRRQE
jgi:hypothetical protein